MSNLSVFAIPRRLGLQFLRFTGVGAAATLSHYAVLVALVHGLHLAPTLASALGFSVGAVVNYGLNYRFTFASDKRHTEAFTKFLIVALTGLTLNTVIMAIAIGLGLHYLLAQVLATGLVLVWNFCGHYLWTFRA